jgi:hypothetical protein
MWWHTCRNQISSFGETDESIKSAGASVQSTTGSLGVRISGSNAGYTMFRGSVKSTGYTLHSPVSPSLPLPCVTCAITFQLDCTNCIGGWEGATCGPNILERKQKFAPAIFRISDRRVRSLVTILTTPSRLLHFQYEIFKILVECM